jgi:hypothetical protein
MRKAILCIVFITVMSTRPTEKLFFSVYLDRHHSRSTTPSISLPTKLISQTLFASKTHNYSPVELQIC